MKLLAAAIQMSCDPLQVASNLERAEVEVTRACHAGAELIVLPEMFNTGYGALPDYSKIAEERDGPTSARLADWCRRHRVTIAAGFVERESHHLYDSLGLWTPDGRVQVYRKQNLVFWERFRFRPGQGPLIAQTPWGRVGLAICADMIYRRVWDDYRHRVDLAIVAAAWPDFACRHSGRKHWLLGHLGPLSSQIPRKAAMDLGVPVVFANQCGATRTTIPMIGMLFTDRIADRFAGQSRIVDGLHGEGQAAGVDPGLILSPVTLHSRKGSRPCRITFPSVPAATSSASDRS